MDPISASDQMNDANFPGFSNSTMSGTSGKAGGLKDLNRSKRLEELRWS
jgi:hypothetical protein